MAEYRSPDWQVANSPLIIVGQIEKIEDGKVANAPKAYDVPQPPPIKPTIATVRITRILKGHYSDTHLRIGSGPIRNCAIYEVHYAFSVGKQMIFILPQSPQNGEVALSWGSSMRPATDTGMVESRIARSIVYRDAYLNKVQKEQPAVYAAAVKFADGMRKSSETWPDPTFVEKGKKGVPVTMDEMVAKRDQDATLEWEFSDQFQNAYDAVLKTLLTTDIDVIRTAHAIEWLNHETTPWWDRQIWTLAIASAARAREQAVASHERTRISNTLKELGVEQNHIDAYRAAINGPDTFLDWSSFPPQLPFADFKAKDTRTTHFILQYFAYDRGAMVADYAVEYRKLADLDPTRVSHLIQALYNDDDEQLRYAAIAAIMQIPGNDFVELVLDDILYKGRYDSWHYLTHPDDPKETARRLGAMIGQASKTLKPEALVCLWTSLRKAECFEPICIEKAMAALDQIEKSAAKSDTAKQNGSRKADDGGVASENDKREDIALALQDYLAAAKLHRELSKGQRLPIVELRQWFNDHPESPMKE